MKKIYVVDESNELQEIEAGVTEYGELSDAPIVTNTLNTTVTEDGTLSTLVNHAWTEDEVLTFCEKAADNRYDILSEKYGHEILFVDSSDILAGRRYRRITVDQDFIYEATAKQWFTISDTSAKSLSCQLLNADDITGVTVVGNTVKLKYYYYSMVGTGTFTVTMNGSTFTAGTAKSGETITIDITNRIVDGNNTISVGVTNVAKSIIMPELNITAIELNYEPTFNPFNAFSGNISYTYRCTGSAYKVLHFDITNANGEITSLEQEIGTAQYATGATVPLRVDYFSHGENKIVTYAYAKDVNSNTLITKTDNYTYHIPFLTKAEPLLMVYFEEWDGLKQYASLSIPYYIWNISDGNANRIEFNLQTSNGSSYSQDYSLADSGAIANYLQYNAEHAWLINSLPAGEARFDISVYESAESEQADAHYYKEGVNIASSAEELQTVNGYIFNFAASDISSTKAMEEWTSTVDGAYTPKVMQLEGFNWTTDGMQIDNEGTQSLHLSTTSKAKLVESTNPLFGAWNTPFTMEIDFKVAANASEDVIIKYYNPNAANPNLYGLFIYPSKAELRYNGGTSTVYFMRGERTNLTYTINTKLNYLFVYINGILSQMQSLANNIKFPTDCGVIEFNTNNNEMDLYAFRGYPISLTSAQVLRNYISNFGSIDIKEKLYLKNNLYFTSSSEETLVPGEYKIDFEEVKGKIPCYVVISDDLPVSKDYMSCHGIFYEKDGETNTQWKNNHSMATTYYYTRTDVTAPWIRNKAIKFGGQGTSSLAYPRKNFKFKHNDKFYIKGHTSGAEKNFTFKADWLPW